MALVTNKDSGFVLSGLSMEPAMLCPGTWDNCDGYVGVLPIPNKSRQSDAGFGPGAGGASVSSILCRITPEQFFEFARAQVVLERLQRKFPQLVGFFPVKRGIVFFTEHPVTRNTRREIMSQVGGVWYRDYVYFCYSSEPLSAGNLALVKKSILKGELPRGYEIAVGDMLEVKEQCPFEPMQVEYCTEETKTAP